MTLLDCYLSWVGMFLPKGSPHKDILAEIFEHLFGLRPFLTAVTKEVRLGRRRPIFRRRSC